MPKQQINILSTDDVDGARQLWLKFSPQTSFYDNWDIRFLFFKQQSNLLKFFIFESDGQEVALLPMQYNPEKEYLEFFGGSYMDDNRIFVLNGREDLVPQIYKSVKDRAFFDNLSSEQNINELKLAIANQIYYLPLDKIKGFGQYDQRFFNGSSKHRKQMQKEIMALSESDIIITKNNFDDIKLLFDLKIKQFGLESGFNTVSEQKTFVDLLKLNYDFHLMTFSVAGKKIGFSLALIYKNKYMFLEMASDFKNYQDIGKYIVIKNIHEAINANIDIIDISRSNGKTWKDRWNFDKKPQYFFKNY